MGIGVGTVALPAVRLSTDDVADDGSAPSAQPSAAPTLVAAAEQLVAAMSNIYASETLQRLAVAAGTAGFGIWEWDVAAGTFEGSAAFRMQFDCGAEGGIREYDVLGALPPADRDAIVAARYAGRDIEAEFAVARGSGERRWLQLRGRAITGISGQPERYAGVTLDVSDRHRPAEARRHQSQFASFP